MSLARLRVLSKSFEQTFRGRYGVAVNPALHKLASINRGLSNNCMQHRRCLSNGTHLQTYATSTSKLTTLFPPSRHSGLSQTAWRTLHNSKRFSTVSNMFSNLPKTAKIVEVGPRDGLQNEKQLVPTATKLELIHRLATSGLTCIEATSFVSPKWVPQMGDHREIITALDLDGKIDYPVLTPNLMGYKAAVAAGAKEVAIFSAASEGFVRRNINASIDESLKRFEDVCDRAKVDGVLVRGYVSCVIECPYDGKSDPEVVRWVSERLLEMGCYEVSLGDTIGCGNPASFVAMLTEVMKTVPVEKLAVHCHDTYGQALANIFASLQLGVNVIDSSVAGLGGCPFAAGASGNVATEDVLYMLNGLGIETGVDLDVVVDAGSYISNSLGKPIASRAANATLAKRAREEVRAIKEKPD
eukprot:m.162333 g.162333  ORF g.162333 m.162333 type:complete len:413 (-) comp31277_c1_seq1:239-1477(-)